MVITKRNKVTGLTLTTMTAIVLGGTFMVAPNKVVPTVTVKAEATSVSSAKKELAGYLAKGKLILANKKVTGIERESVQGYQNLGQEAYDSGNLKNINSLTKQLKEYYSVYDVKGNLIPSSSTNTDDSVDNTGSLGSSSQEGTNDNGNDNYSTNEVEGDNKSDAIKDTQGADEVTKEVDQENAEKNKDNSSNIGHGGTSDTNSLDSSSSKDKDTNTGTPVTDSNAYPTEKNQHTTLVKGSHRAGSKNNPYDSNGKTHHNNSSSVVNHRSNRVNGNRITPNHRGMVTNSSSNVARGLRKGNLPTTGEQRRQTMVASILGILVAFGLGGTGLTMWLRKHSKVDKG